MRREYIRGRFATDLSPAHILHELNKDLLDTGLDKHITVCIGMLDNSNNYLEYSVAGHHPLPILYEKGKAAFIDPGKSSFPIGLVEDAEYFNTRLELAEDFTLFLLSDGILEHLEGGSMADKEDKLLDVITKHQGDFIQVKKALNLNMGIKVPDDIAMLSVTGT